MNENKQKKQSGETLGRKCWCISQKDKVYGCGLKKKDKLLSVLEESGNRLNGEEWAMGPGVRMEQGRYYQNTVPPLHGLILQYLRL